MSNNETERASTPQYVFMPSPSRPVGGGRQAYGTHYDVKAAYEYLWDGDFMAEPTNDAEALIEAAAMMVVQAVVSHHADRTEAIEQVVRRISTTLNGAGY